MVNKVRLFETVDYNDGSGINEIQVLDEECGEVHNESYCIGTRCFDKSSTYLLRNELDEDEDFIISKKAYNKVVQIHERLVTDLMALFDANASLLEIQK